MDLSVQVAGKAPYMTSRKEFIPLILLGQIAPGSTMPVKVDPINANDVVIQWNQPGSTAPPSDTSETLDQVASALVGTGLGAAAPFATANQGSYTVDQSRVSAD